MTDRRDDELRRRLTPIQYEVTRHNATEPPFANPYWDNDEEGLYVDVVTGEPLFSSRHQFDAGCGWPSFDRTLAGAPVTEHREYVDSVYAANGSTGQRRAFGTCIHRRANGDGTAVLHQFRRAPLYPGERSRAGRIRRLRHA